MIDANQQRFWMLSDAAHFDLDEGSLTWDETLQVLRLSSSRPASALPSDRGRARELADESTPVTFDAYDTWAKASQTRDTVLAGGVFDEPQQIHALAPDESIRDLAMGSDGVLYAVVHDGDDAYVHLVNRKGSREEGKKEYVGYDDSRYDIEVVKVLPVSAGRPDRVVALPQGGALLLDRAGRRFWQVIGEPQRDQPQAVFAPETPRPHDDGPTPQRLIERPDLALPPGTVVAMASSPTGDVAVLLHPTDESEPAAVVLIRDGDVGAPVPLAGTNAPFSIGWAGGSTWALMYADRPERREQEAIGYPVPFLEASPPTPLGPVGHRFPLNRGADEGQSNQGFCNGLSRPVRYPSTDAKGRFLLRPLNALSLPAYPTRAVSRSRSEIDGGRHGAVWHRIYLEAHIPAGAGVRVRLSASNEMPDGETPPAEDRPWAEHHFGASNGGPDVPRGSWVAEASEVPYHPGLLYCEPRRDTAGLFVALVQRPGYASRSLTGRYLRVELELTGNGHVTPEVAALRVYGPRTSYAREYLPELYAEQRFADEADDLGTATGADFLERFLCLFEGILTPLEDKIAGAHLLSNPCSAPADALDWLAQWVSMSVEEGFSEEKKRELIRHATTLHRWRGTMTGLRLALDLATDRWVETGAIVLLEDFRLRRTVATILGADLSVDDDPLLAGPIANANSFVGDTLILGEESKQEFFALFSRDVIEAEDRAEVVDRFVDRLADRLTVLVHEHTSAEDIALIRRVVSLEAPAHIDFRIVPASKPLLVGLYSLVGVDTFLQAEPARRFARIGHSYLGRYDFIRKLPVLDDRMLP